MYVIIAIGKTGRPSHPATLSRIILKFKKHTTVQYIQHVSAHFLRTIQMPETRKNSHYRRKTVLRCRRMSRRGLVWISTYFDKKATFVCFRSVVFVLRKRQQVQQYWPRTKHTTGVSWYVNDVRVALDEHDPQVERNTHVHTRFKRWPGDNWTATAPRYSQCYRRVRARTVVVLLFRIVSAVSRTGASGVRTQ